MHRTTPKPNYVADVRTKQGFRQHNRAAATETGSAKSANRYTGRQPQPATPYVKHQQARATVSVSNPNAGTYATRRQDRALLNSAIHHEPR